MVDHKSYVLKLKIDELLSIIKANCFNDIDKGIEISAEQLILKHLNTFKEVSNSPKGIGYVARESTLFQISEETMIPIFTEETLDDED